MGRVGGLDRTFRPNKTCYNYDDGCYIYRQDIVHSMLSLPGSSSLLGKCPYSVAHPKPVVNVIHYKLSRLHHHTLSQSLQGQPVLSCPVTSMSLKLWFTLKMAVTFFPAARQGHWKTLLHMHYGQPYSQIWKSEKHPWCMHWVSSCH